jgi:hypothetical protein
MRNLLGALNPLPVPLRAEWQVRRRWGSRRAGGLAAPGIIRAGAAVISLTSHSRRFGKLHLTLKCLLMQRAVRRGAAEVVLWIGDAHHPNLPRSVSDLVSSGLTIRVCDDLGPHTKLVPALRAYPDRTILVCDDDCHYGPEWADELLAAIDPARREIPCNRAHIINLRPDGAARPYVEWSKCVALTVAHERVFPTGVGGIAFAPGCLAETVLDAQVFRQICPTADDIWIYANARMNDHVFRALTGYRDLTVWRGSQDGTLPLMELNVRQGGNDRQFANVIDHFGLSLER